MQINEPDSLRRSVRQVPACSSFILRLPMTNWLFRTVMVLVVIVSSLGIWQLFRNDLPFAIRSVRVSIILVTVLTAVGIAALNEFFERRDLATRVALSEERLQTAMNAGKSSVWEIDFQAGRSNWFGDARTIFGVPSNIFSISDFFRYVHPEDRALVEQQFVRARNTQTQFVAEFRVIHEDGVVLCIRAAGAFTYTNGAPSRLLGIASDISHYKQVHTVLIKSEEKFSKLFHDNPIPMALANAHSQCYVEVNEAFATLTRRSRGYFVGRSPLDLDVWPGSVNWEEIMQRVGRAGTTRHDIMRYRDGSGVERVGLGSATVIEVEGEPHILSAFLDITDHSQADEALNMREANLEGAQHLAQIGSWQWDPRTRETRWSGELYRIHGLDPALPPPSYEDLPRYFTADSWRKLREAMTISAKSGLVPAVDLELIRPDGTRRWVSTHGQAVRNADGEISVFRGTTQDITERKHTMDRLIESEQRFRLVADTAPVMIWMSGADQMFNYVNKPWLDFTGGTLGELVRNGWWQSVHSEDLPNWQKVYTEMFNRKESFTVEYRLRRHDGEYRWILNTGVPRFNGDGSFAGYIGSCIDISERKIAQQALADVGRRLIEAHEEERTWIARELHDDINQRLALLVVELERWSQTVPLTAESSEQGHRIRQRLSGIAKDVQHLSHRLHSSKLEYLGLATAAKSFCKEISEENMVEVSFRHGGIPKSLSKDIALSMFRVLQEALQNAVKHSGVRNFTVDLYGTSNEIVLSVTDAGRGFDEQQAIKKRGLGLISMRERVQLVNGDFSIASKPDAGTTIHARIPLKSTEPRSLAG